MCDFILFFFLCCHHCYCVCYGCAWYLSTAFHVIITSTWARFHVIFASAWVRDHVIITKTWVQIHITITRTWGRTRSSQDIVRVHVIINRTWIWFHVITTLHGFKFMCSPGRELEFNAHHRSWVRVLVIIARTWSCLPRQSTCSE